MIRDYILPRLRRHNVADVHQGDVRALHQWITKRGTPARANRTLSVLSKMFSLAMQPREGEAEAWRPAALGNPCKGVARNPEQNRRRYLSPDEIAALVEALNAYPGRSAANCVLFLLLTGARRGEALAARWGEIDLADGVWRKPSAHTKQRFDHEVPLSGPARLVLQEMRPKDAQPNDFVFPGRKLGESLKQLVTCWRWVTKRAGIEAARLHDLRHTHASLLVSSGASLPLIGALLGHTQAATTHRYAHLAVDPLRKANDQIGTRIAVAMGNGKSLPAEVTPMKRPNWSRTRSTVGLAVRGRGRR